MLGKGAERGELAHGTRFFAGCTPYPQDSSGTPPARGPPPRPVVRRRVSPSPRLAPPSATGHRPGAHVPGRRAWRRRAADELARVLLRVYVRSTKEGGPSGPECDEVHSFCTSLRPVHLTRLWACATLKGSGQQGLPPTNRGQYRENTNRKRAPHRTQDRPAHQGRPRPPDPRPAQDRTGPGQVQPSTPPRGLRLVLRGQ